MSGCLCVLLNYSFANMFLRKWLKEQVSVNPLSDVHKAAS